MRLVLLPLFKPENFSQANFTPTGLEYFSANVLAELIAFINQQLPEVECFIRLTLSDTLKTMPDVIFLWSTSTCFGLVGSLAEQFKNLLDAPVWLGGPHISYLPNSLPDQVDLGILGEAEVPLLHLLKAFLKQGTLSAMDYRKIPGIVYQSRGRMYSGAPAQEIANAKSLPCPRSPLFLDIPGFSAPVVRTARINDNLLTALAYPPTRKPRLLSSQQICEQMLQIVRDYGALYQSLPFPTEAMHYLRPVFIPDYQLFTHPERLDALKAEMLAHNLPKQLFLMMHIQPQWITAELLKTLKAMNVRKLVWSLGPFGHQQPLLSQATPQQVRQALQLCQEYHIGVVGQLYLTPDVQTRRQQLLQTYRFYYDEMALFERLHVSVLGPFPGTTLWEAYQAKRKPDAQVLQAFPWDSLDWEKYIRNMPLAQVHLNAAQVLEIYDGFQRLLKVKNHFTPPLQEDSFHLSRALQVQQFARQYLSPEDRILEVVLDPELALKPFLGPYHQIEQVWVVDGKLQSALPQEPVDILLMVGSIAGLREPQQTLASLLPRLKPQGRIYLQSPNPTHLSMISRVLKWPGYASSARYKQLKFLRADHLRLMVEELGLEMVHADYTIMEGVESVRPTVETLAAHLEKFAGIQISQHTLYISEIKMLARKK